jgi:hypothetical protein
MECIFSIFCTIKEDAILNIDITLTWLGESQGSDLAFGDGDSNLLAAFSKLRYDLHRQASMVSQDRGQACII